MIIVKERLFEIELQKVGIDLEYRKYLHTYKSDYDVFGIVIDRDYKTHSLKKLYDIYNYCIQKNYKVFITNPCIEFWLLLHICNIKKEYGNQLENFIENKLVSNNHNFVSKLLSEKAGHRKNISENIFKKIYLKAIEKAISQINENFTDDPIRLIGNKDSEKFLKGELGSNLNQLISLLRE